MPTVILIKENATKEIEASNLKEIYKKLNLNPTIFIASRDNELIIPSTLLKPSDKIKLIPVISGG